MEIFEYPVTITPDEFRTARGTDLVAEMKPADIASFLNGVYLSVYDGCIYATGDRRLKDKIINAHREHAETAIKRALVMQAEYELSVGRIGTESGITVTADGQKAIVTKDELRSKTVCIDAVNALKACAVNLLYAGES